MNKESFIMRTINTDIIVETVKEMCISANLYLADDMDKKLRQAAKEEDGVFIVSGKAVERKIIDVFLKDIKKIEKTQKNA